MDASNHAEQESSHAAEERRVLELVRLAREGDMPAAEQLVQTFQTPMFNLAYRMVNQREEACDLTQEIFIRMIRALRSFRGSARFSTWLHALAVNTCRSRMRRLRRIGFFEAHSLDAPPAGREDEGPPREAVDAGEQPGMAVERRETQEIVGRAIARLPEEFREVVVMRDIQGLSYEEISRATGCQEGTVKSRLWRGRARVRDELLREGALCRANG
jgi:RNA polymerase sigma-70 factor (ECF subfamily)